MLYQLSYSPSVGAYYIKIFPFAGGLLCYNTHNLKYKYLYQDKGNNNLEGEIDAKNRDEAYKLLRKQGIRPYRVIGDDPWNWRPWALSAGYVILSVALVVVGIVALSQARQLRELQQLEAEEEIY